MNFLSDIVIINGDSFLFPGKKKNIGKGVDDVGASWERFVLGVMILLYSVQEW